MQQKATGDLRNEIASLANHATTLNGSSVMESSEKTRFNVLDINDALHRISNIKGGSVSSIDQVQLQGAEHRQMTDRAPLSKTFAQEGGLE